MKNMRNRGFSLVELLISMTIGVVLISGAITVFSGNKRNSELSSAMSDLQENARFTLQMLSQQIRQSGSQGCLDINRGQMVIHSTLSPSDDLRASSTAGYDVISDQVWLPSPPPSFTVPVDKNLVHGSHVLSLQYAGSTYGKLNIEMASPAGFLWIDNNISLVPGDLAVIANCDTADLFTVSHFWGWSTGSDSSQSLLLHRATHNTTGNLSRAYGDARTIAQTRVMPFHSNIYYVADTGLENDYGDPIRALYQQSFPYNDPNNPPVELIQGVENMRLAFGIRESSGNLRYVAPTDALYDPARVESVKIGLLLTSWDRIATSDDETTYLLAGQPIHASDKSTNALTHAKDKRFRLAFNTTVKVRNRRNTE